MHLLAAATLCGSQTLWQSCQQQLHVQMHTFLESHIIAWSLYCIIFFTLQTFLCIIDEGLCKCLEFVELLFISGVKVLLFPILSPVRGLNLKQSQLSDTQLQFMALTDWKMRNGVRKVGVSGQGAVAWLIST